MAGSARPVCACPRVADITGSAIVTVQQVQAAGRRGSKGFGLFRENKL